MILKDGKPSYFGNAPIIATAENSTLKMYADNRFVPNQTFNNYKVTPQVIDLTTMFGAGKEPKTVAEVQKYILPNTYYPYTPIVQKEIQKLSNRISNTGDMINKLATKVEINTTEIGKKINGYSVEDAKENITLKVGQTLIATGSCFQPIIIRNPKNNEVIYTIPAWNTDGILIIGGTNQSTSEVQVSWVVFSGDNKWQHVKISQGLVYRQSILIDFNPFYGMKQIIGG